MSSGPTSLIQFKVWQCGTIDLNMLYELLKSALRHSVCDIILEYYLLTAPVCRVPNRYCKGMLSPLHHSAPSSPSNTVSTGIVDIVRVRRINKNCLLFVTASISALKCHIILHGVTGRGVRQSRIDSANEVADT